VAILVTSCTMFRAVYKLSSAEKYAKYFGGIEGFISRSYFFEDDPLGVHGRILKNAGLKAHEVRSEEKGFQCDSVEDLKGKRPP
jgi:hypothetical protein